MVAAAGTASMTPRKPNAAPPANRAKKPGGRLPGGGQPDIGIQGREEPAVRPGSLPPQREHGGLTTRHHVQYMHLDQLGHARRGTQRAVPGQASKAITVGSLRRASQRPAASQIREPGRRGREAQVHKNRGSYEHLSIGPDNVTPPPGTKVPAGHW